MKNPFIFFVILIFISTCGGSIFFLLRSLKKDRKLIAIVGLFCLSMGLFLLILDLILITFVHGAQHIPDYLLFNRLVSDTGFAGRWVLTVYLFICTGYASSIYLLAGNLIKKFNRGKTKNI